MVDEGAALAIGIDLGRTKARVGLLWPDGRVEILPNAKGKRTTPCYVAFTENEVLIGENARYQAAMNPTNTIYDMTRLIGRRFNDASVQEDMKSWPFKVIRGTNDVPMIVVSHEKKSFVVEIVFMFLKQLTSWPFNVMRGSDDVAMIVDSHAHEEKKFSAVEVISMFLKNLKEVAEDYLGRTVDDAVITVPVDFFNSRRQAVKEAGQVAGFNVLEVISEPVAAATAYGLHMRTKTNALIFYFGRTTLDVSLVSIDENGKLEVKAFSSDSYLGGQNIDTMIVHNILKEIRNYKYIYVNPYPLSRLRGLCKKAKKSLSSASSVYIEVNSKAEEYLLSRTELERLITSLFSKCTQTVEKCLRDARINKEDIDEVVLVGGSTRIPKVRQLLYEFFNRKKLCTLIDPSEAIAYGAAIVAEKLSREKSQKAKNLVLLDTVPLSLGVDAHDGTFSVIVPRNTPIPVKKERIYFTTKDDQESIYFNVYQGDRSKAKDNNLLGNFEVVVPPAPRGTSKVKVVFSIDVDSILNCWVKELTTGLKKKIIIDNEKLWISKVEIEKMLKDAENYKVEDQRYKKKVFARNALEEYVYNVKRKVNTIKSNNMMIPHNEDMEKIENVIKSASQYLDLNELAHVDEYQNKLNELEKLCVPIIAQLM